MKRIAVLPIVLFLIFLLACGAPQTEVPEMPAAETVVGIAEAETPTVMPVKPLAGNTTENRVEAIRETALAFYYHNPYVQYDNSSVLEVIGSACGRNVTALTPEGCGLDTPLFSVCSDYAHKVVKQALGFDMMGLTQERFITKRMTLIDENDPLCVFKLDDGKKAGDHTGLTETVKGIMKPGDILVFFNDETSHAGHTVVYTGDIFGDGEDTRLELSGKNLDRKTFEDPRERNGGVLRGDLLKKTMTEKWRTVNTRYAVFRPAEMAEAALTPAAQVRLRYPRMELRKEFSKISYHNVVDGETMTVTISVTNHSGGDYTELYLSDPVPEGQVVVRADGGGQLQSGELVWLLTVPAGETVTVSYDVLLHGAIGEYVKFPAGAVDGMLSTREAEFRFGAPMLTQEQQKLFFQRKEELAKLAEDCVSVTEFVDRTYELLFGVKPELPQNVGEVVSAVTKRGTYDGAACLIPAVPETDAATRIYRMLIPKCVAGSSVLPYKAHDPSTAEKTDMNNRITAYWKEYFLPGDVFFVLKDHFDIFDPENAELQLILDDFHCMVVSYYGGKPSVSFMTFFDSVQRNTLRACVIGLRPSQVGIFQKG